MAALKIPENLPQLILSLPLYEVSTWAHFLPHVLKPSEKPEQTSQSVTLLRSEPSQVQAMTTSDRTNPSLCRFCGAFKDMGLQRSDVMRSASHSSQSAHCVHSGERGDTDEVLNGKCATGVHKIRKIERFKKRLEHYRIKNKNCNVNRIGLKQRIANWNSCQPFRNWLMVFWFMHKLKCVWWNLRDVGLSVNIS